MEYVLKKTYLGLAVEEAVQELGLQRMKKEINQCFRDAFMDNYNQIMQKYKSKPIAISGIQQKMKESPIQPGDKYSCLAVAVSSMNYGEVQFLGKTKGVTCMQLYEHRGNTVIKKREKRNLRKKRKERKKKKGQQGQKKRRGTYQYE